MSTKVTELTDEYLEFLKKEGINEKTIYENKIFIKQIIKQGFDDTYIQNFSLDKTHDILFKLKPRNIKIFTVLYSHMSSLLKWCVKNEYLSKEEFEHFYNINKRELFMNNKKNDSFIINNLEYQSLLNDIEKNDFNPLYLTTLYMCIYEGIYTSELYELIHMRREHIDEYTNSIRLIHNNKTTTTLKISPILADNLIELSNLNEWYRKNNSGLYGISINGMYEDSVFKIESRGVLSEESFKHCFYRRLRSVNKNYLNKKMTLLDICKSGILHRVNEKSKKEGVYLKNYFEDTKTKKIIKVILQEELNRINYNMDATRFMTSVKEDIHIFD